MNTTTEKPKKTLKGEAYRKWHSRYHEVINKCAIKYRNQNKDAINKRARDRFNSNQEYRQKKLDAMKRYREKKKKERQALLLEQKKIDEEKEKEKVEIEQKVRDLALEREFLLEKLEKMSD